MLTTHSVIISHEEVCYYPFSAPFHVSAIITAAVIIPINLFVIYLFIKTKNLRQSPANYILFSLAFNDLISGTSILLHITPNLYFLHVGCNAKEEALQIKFIAFTTVAYFVSKIALLSSVGHLLILSSDRIFAIFYALRYNGIVTKKRVIKSISVLWIGANVLTLIELSWINSEKKMLYARIYSTISIICFSILPIIILSVQYVLMLLFIHRLVKVRKSSSKKVYTERKALFVYLAMFVSFVTFCLPFFTVKFISVFNVDTFSEMVPNAVLEAVFILRFIISLTNPIIYTLYKQDFRGSLRKNINYILKYKKRSIYETEMSMLRTNAQDRTLLSPRDNITDKCSR